MFSFYSFQWKLRSESVSSWCIPAMKKFPIYYQINKLDDMLLFSHSVMSDSATPWMQHARLLCPSPAPGAYSNSWLLSQWCHSTISSSVVPFISCLESFLATESFLMSWLVTSGGQSIRVSASASVLSMNIQDRFPLEWTVLISLLFRGLSRVFSRTTVQKDQFFKLWFKAMKLKDACSLEEKLWQT